MKSTQFSEQLLRNREFKFFSFEFMMVDTCTSRTFIFSKYYRWHYNKLAHDTLNVFLSRSGFFFFLFSVCFRNYACYTSPFLTGYYLYWVFSNLEYEIAHARKPPPPPTLSIQVPFSTHSWYAALSDQSFHSYDHAKRHNSHGFVCSIFGNDYHGHKSKRFFVHEVVFGFRLNILSFMYLHLL